MAGDVVNLRLARRRRERAGKAAKADANRLHSSIPGKQRRANEARKAIEEARHEGHFLAGPAPDRG